MARHCYVLIHGFFGNPSHVEAMKKTLLSKLPDDEDVDVLIPQSNAGLRSFDGLVVGSYRIVEELAQFLSNQAKQGIKYDRISFTGYSMGGLYARYVVGILNENGFFNKVQPLIFTTFACPHVGSTFHDNGVVSRVMNFLGTNFLGVSGTDMFGSTDILDELCDPNKVYWQALAKFKHRLLFANATHDRTVPFFTAYICDKDPFAKRDYIDFVYFDACAETHDGQNSKFFVDMQNSQFRQESSGVDANPTLQERQFQVFAWCALPLVFPVVLTLTSVSTLVSRYRVKEANRARAANKSQLIRDKSHSETVAELTYYAIDDIFLEGQSDKLSPIDCTINEGPVLRKNSAPEPIQAACGDGYQGLVESTPNTIPVNSKTKQHINNLNSLGWEKYAVRLRKMHSHAEIVNRRNLPGQGQQVLEFWAANVASKLKLM